MYDMRLVGYAIVLGCTSIAAQAQPSDLFRSFDCREYAEYAFDEPEVVAEVSADSVASTTVAPQPVISIDTVDGWKHWSAVDNYSFGKDRGGLSMINDLSALHPFFRDRVINLIELCEKKGIKLALVETYRTPAKQLEYKTMGKKYTSSGAGRSKHQYGLAVDVVPIVDSVAVWDNTALWKKVGIVGEKIGLRWGGRWRKPFDPGHFEWTGGLTSTNLSAGLLPTVPKSDEHYPCLDEDLKLLRKYWSEWETTQSSLTRK